jgi:hypothetical protein
MNPGPGGTITAAVKQTFDAGILVLRSSDA